MNKTIVLKFLAIIGAFSLDSTILYFLPYDATKSGLDIIPYIGVLLFLLIINDLETAKCYPFTILISMYYMVVYGNSLPIYIVLFVVSTYFLRRYMKMSPFSWLEFALVSISTVMFIETVVYILMWITNITELTAQYFLLNRLLPTLALVLICTVIMFYFYAKQSRFDSTKNKFNIEY